jgi:four helix bundle protein
MNNIKPDSEYKKPSSYKDLVVWQKSIEFAIKVIDIAENLGQSKRHFRLIEQLEAAVTSIPMNIAEGKGRKSTKEYQHFLMIARGSLYETMTLLEIFRLKGWVSQEEFQSLEVYSDEIGKMINGLYGKLRG